VNHCNLFVPDIGLFFRFYSVLVLIFQNSDVLFNCRVLVSF